MRVVTKFRHNYYDVKVCLIKLGQRHTASLRNLNLVTTNISPSILAYIPLPAFGGSLRPCHMAK